MFLFFCPMLYGMPFRNLICRSTLFQVNLVIVILLLSGDVQLNPGPPTRTPKYPCGVCSKNVNCDHKAMECEDCLTWYHIKALTWVITCIKYICIITHIHGYALNVVFQTSQIHPCSQPLPSVIPFNY